MKKIVFTCGDPNGIGPEIVIKTLNKIYNPEKYKIYFLSPANVFEEIIETVQPEFDYVINANEEISNSDNTAIEILDLGFTNLQIGKPTKESGKVSFKAIQKAFQLADFKKADAVVTAPISKYALNLAGVKYPGHTEMFAEWSRVDHHNMMFISPKMKCALLTIHTPIKNVSKLITAKRILDSVEVITDTLLTDFKIKNPKIALLGLNPHAGENGMIGDEETKTIIPAMEKSEFRGNLFGPFVPDAFFANHLYKNYDCTIGMYHDQILIPFKMISFSVGVNYTAGLPIIRTSPDHGTAFDIAGTNSADEKSMIEAFKVAVKIADNRKNNARKKS